jgi:hypothetical protein
MMPDTFHHLMMPDTLHHLMMPEMLPPCISLLMIKEGMVHV